MAFGMKHFVGSCLTGCALVALWALPPSQNLATGWKLKSAEQIRLESLEDELTMSSRILARLQWSDSLSADVRAPEAGDVQVIVPAGIDIAPQQVDRLTRLVEADAQRLAPEPRMRFAMVWQDPDVGHHPDAPRRAYHRTEYLTGERDDEPYCMAVNVVHEWRMPRQVMGHFTRSSTVGSRTSTLGLCAWLLRYGMPSTSIERWLSAGAAHFGLEHGPARDVRTYPERWVFGVRWNQRPLAVQQCLARQTEGCATAFLRPESGANSGVRDRSRRLVEESPVLWADHDATGFRGLTEYDPYLLHDLEQDFGPEAFERFWSSDLDVGEAFEAAFGTDAGTWVAEWVDRTRGTDPAGPELVRATTAGSTLTLVLFLFWAFLAQRRRTVV